MSHQSPMKFQLLRLPSVCNCQMARRNHYIAALFRTPKLTDLNRRPLVCVLKIHATTFRLKNEWDCILTALCAFHLKTPLWPLYYKVKSINYANKRRIHANNSLRKLLCFQRVFFFIHFDFVAPSLPILHSHSKSPIFMFCRETEKKNRLNIHLQSVFSLNFRH